MVRSKSRWRVAAVLLAQVACVAFVAHTLWKNRAELEVMPRIQLTDVLLLLGLNVIGHLQRTVEFTYMLRKLQIREPFGEGFLLTGAGFLLNHLPLNAGFIMRAMVLQRDHKLPYAAYVSLTMVNAVINVAVCALLTLVGLSITENAVGVSPYLFWTLAGMLAAALLSLYVTPLLAPRQDNWLGRQIRGLAQGVAMIRGNGTAVLVMAWIAFTKVVILALRFAICFRVLSLPMSALGNVLVAVTQNLMAIVNITPGNLGLREIVVSIVAGELGASRTLGLAAASIDRVVSLGYVVLVGLPGIYSLKARSRASA
ncbi:MAG: hypothetical protein RL033_6311 [Pseudomonadota bacterium]